MSAEQKSDRAPSRGIHRFWLSVGLGLLTLVTTPLVTIISVLPLVLWSSMGKKVDAITLMARAAGLEGSGLGGYFLSAFLLIAFFALLGDLAAAVISWRVNGSIRSGLVTFASALLLQFGSAAWFVPRQMQQTHQQVLREDEAMERFQQSFRGFAEMGDVTFDLQARSPENVDNPHPEYGAMFWNLELGIPVSVARQGTYEFAVTYEFSKGGLQGHTPREEVRQVLEPGSHVVKVTLKPWEAGEMGYWAPDRVGGKCRVVLCYLASDQEYLDAMRSDPAIGKREMKGIEEAARKWGHRDPSEPWRRMDVGVHETIF